jgi:hypothetical protein
MSTRTTVRRASPVVLAALLAGCAAPPEPPEADVSGTVYYRDRPVSGGLITFVSERGRNAGAVIDPSGRYQARVRVGAMKVTVNNLMLRKDQASATRLKTAVPDAPPDVKGTYRELPKKYLSPDTSGLSFTVQPGAQTYDIQL